METQPSIPEDVTDLSWITNGVSGATFAVSESAIIKIPLPLENCKEQLAIERKIYERLGPHPYITKLLYTHKGTIVLERLQYPLRRRLLDIREQKQLPVAQDVVRWGWQTAQALQHIHSRGVMQVDIGPHNILLDWDGNAKLSDFAGSSLDGSEPMVFPSAHSEHPDIPTTNPSIQSELFALGSTLYEIETTYKPYPDKNDRELAKLFKANKFPDTRELILGKVITKCWMAGYKDASEAVVDILHIQDRLNDLILSDKLQMVGRLYNETCLLVTGLTKLVPYFVTFRRLVKPFVNRRLRKTDGSYGRGTTGHIFSIDELP